ncbi:hypothetical protein DYB32_007369, partial [Aphanomyces invadans]
FSDGENLMRPTWMDDPKPLLTPGTPAPTQSRRQRVWVVVMALGVATCMVVLLLPHKKELPLNNATGLLIDGTANFTFWYRNNSHWLPEADLGKIYQLMAPLLAVVVSSPKNNSLFFPASNTTVQFRAQVWSPKECSTIARALNKSFFTYIYPRQLCLLNDPPASMALNIGSADSTSKADCLASCNRTLSCMGMTYRSRECTHYKAMTSNATIMAGWIVPTIKAKTMVTNATTVPPAVEFSNKTIQRVHIYGIAHQDDRELFMANAIYATFQDRVAKGVFVYTTAGDANLQDGWWEAREVGTLAVTDFGVKDAGHYTTTRKDILISICNHTVRKVSIGNAVHYFLRISEANMTTMMTSSDLHTHLPLGMVKMTDKRYTNLTDVQAVVRAILRWETAGIPSVSAFVPEYIEKGNDHVLHTGTGQLVVNAIAAEPGLHGCVTTSTYYGYQHWLDAMNMKEPIVTFQRRAWLALSSALDPVYPNRDVWSNHGMNLGRTYVARVTQATPGVGCKV